MGGVEPQVGVVVVEAREALAGVLGPDDVAVREGRREWVMRQRGGGSLRRGAGEAAAAGEGVAAAED